MAVSATLRSGTGSRPMPTVTRLVVARTAVAEAIPLSLKQSSQTHSCASPAASAAAATAPSRSGGWSGVKMAASVGITRARNARASGW
jgi:hypothetical protein